jgi:MSHA biogenesis protein MshJ
VSLKTLPVTSLTDQAEVNKITADKDKTDKKPGAESIYRHGVEITVQGGYQDIVRYLAALEAMRWQLFWGGANLSVEEHPKTNLTLTLYTLSLDRKWLNL